MNKGSNFIGGSFSNRENVRAQIQFRRRVNPNIVKDDFSSRTDQSIFISIAPMFLDWSTETRLVNHSVLQFKFRSQFQLLPQIRCVITFRVGSSIISIDSNIIDNIIRKFINVQQEKCRTKNTPLRLDSGILCLQNVFL